MNSHQILDMVKRVYPKYTLLSPLKARGFSGNLGSFHLSCQRVAGKSAAWRLIVKRTGSENFSIKALSLATLEKWLRVTARESMRGQILTDLDIIDETFRSS